MAQIQRYVFCCSALESFTAPASLREIGLMAFRECHNLRSFTLNEGFRKLDLLCLWGTGLTDLRIPPHVGMTPEQLGVMRDPKVLRLPDGLEAVKSEWFSDNKMEKVFIPSTVRELGSCAFCGCKQLREAIFEPDSELRIIKWSCFSGCGLEEVTIPKSVRTIEEYAFSGCHSLRSLTFEEGSRLMHVGKGIVDGTQLDEKDVEFPEEAKVARGRE